MEKEIMKISDALLYSLEESWKLIGSAGSLEQLAELLKSKWYWSEVEFKEVADTTGIYDVLSSKNKHDALRVIKKGNRYRLEMEQK
jgi:hypothetical protein